MAISEDRRIQYEHNWANHTAKRWLERGQRSLWHTFKYTTRTFAYDGKTYVVWRLTEEGCEVLDTLKLVAAGLSLTSGLTATLVSRACGEVQLNEIPSKLPGLDVFIWVPAFNEVRFTPRDWNNADDERVLRVALNFKQMCSLAQGPEFDVHYLSELRDFERLNPNVAV